jgi:hypothetical protein
MGGEEPPVRRGGLGGIAPPEEERRRGTRRADADQLDRAGRHFAVGQGAEVAAQAAALPGTGEIVIQAEGRGGRSREREGSDGRGAFWPC